MLVMPANVASHEVKRLMNEFPNMIGHLFSPKGWKTPPGKFALDNGRFCAGPDWSERDWMKLIHKACAHSQKTGVAPEWILVPDVVADWKATVREFSHWESRVRNTGWKVAVAVQNGASVADVKAMGVDVVFVGGTTEWKLRTTALWCSEFPRVHVGRVNTLERAIGCFQCGAESIDGTGWMRTTRQRKTLRVLLEMMSGKRPEPLWLFDMGKKLTE